MAGSYKVYERAWRREQMEIENPKLLRELDAFSGNPMGLGGVRELVLEIFHKRKLIKSGKLKEALMSSTAPIKVKVASVMVLEAIIASLEIKGVSEDDMKDEVIKLLVKRRWAFFVD